MTAIWVERLGGTRKPSLANSSGGGRCSGSLTETSCPATCALSCSVCALVTASPWPAPPPVTWPPTAVTSAFSGGETSTEAPMPPASLIEETTSSPAATSAAAMPRAASRVSRCRCLWRMALGSHEPTTSTSTGSKLNCETVMRRSSRATAKRLGVYTTRMSTPVSIGTTPSVGLTRMSAPQHAGAEALSAQAQAQWLF